MESRQENTTAEMYRLWHDHLGRSEGKMNCPIKLSKIHCPSCYFTRDGKCEYRKITKTEGKANASR